MARHVPQAFASMRYLLFGGEAVDPQWVRTVLEQGAPEELLHVYGPTENTTFSTWQRVERVADNAMTVPIGGPIMNTQAYVLDQWLKAVPIGVAGELYLGGAGLAREYLRRPDLTAEKFVPHPYSREAGERLYRTGDVVRWRESGELEFIGRVDGQVKIRGFRVEPGEIEAVLQEYRAVVQAVVVVRDEEVSERKRLVAYVVAEEGVEPSRAELNGYLKEKLPDYMVPSAIVLLESLPLTANGKVDRGVAGAGMEYEYGVRGAADSGGRITDGDLGGCVAGGAAGCNDNFFDLGGHSLLATQVISRVRTAFQTEVAVRTLFESPTIASFAEAIEKGSAARGH